MNAILKPYYQDNFTTIYHGDSREILPELLNKSIDVVITDPVWPNADKSLYGSDDPFSAFKSVARFFPLLTQRVVVQLGCDSDPRFLSAVPSEYHFFRVCWLEYLQPNYKGRLLYTGDIAYVFGIPPPARRGAMVLPGKCLHRSGGRPRTGHPCSRQLSHVQWLVGFYAAGLVLDPFMGGGTTLVAAKNHGLPSIGIEINEKYCEISAKRLSQEQLDFTEKA